MHFWHRMGRYRSGDGAAIQVRVAADRTVHLRLLVPGASRYLWVKAVAMTLWMVSSGLLVAAVVALFVSDDAGLVAPLLWACLATFIIAIFARLMKPWPQSLVDDVARW